MSGPLLLGEDHHGQRAQDEELMTFLCTQTREAFVSKSTQHPNSFSRHRNAIREVVFWRPAFCCPGVVLNILARPVGKYCQHLPQRQWHADLSIHRCS